VSDAFNLIAPEMETKRLRLRRLSIDDSRDVYAYASDPEVARFALWPPHDAEESTKAFIRFLTRPALLNWAILQRSSDKVIGMVFLHSLNAHHRKAEIAFNLARQHWNKGLVTEAACNVLNFAFHALELNRVEATCMPGNLAARRVLKKMGMTHEGRMRRSHFRYDGSHDMDLFAILADEFG